MANPNIVSLTSILGVLTPVTSISTGTSTLISAPSTGHVFRNVSITISNKTGTNCWVTVYIGRGLAVYYLAYQMTVPANATLNLTGRDLGLYLQDTDSVTGIAQTASALDALCTYEDIS